MRNVDQVRADANGINAHFDGATAAFTAEAPNGEAKSGRSSIDQVRSSEVSSERTSGGHGPDAGCRYILPPQPSWSFRRHSYNQNGTVAAAMQERPRDVFDRVFGAIAQGEVKDPRQLRLKKSVLDSVVNEYRYFTGANSPLGAASKGRVTDHLERIREYEQRAYALNDSPKEFRSTRPDEIEAKARRVGRFRADRASTCRLGRSGDRVAIDGGPVRDGD